MNQSVSAWIASHDKGTRHKKRGIRWLTCDKCGARAKVLKFTTVVGPREMWYEVEETDSGDGSCTQ